MARPKAAEDDPFRPPDIPILVRCIHCGREYDSYLIEWVEEPQGSSLPGFWCCPMPGCDGKGFGFDILPVDPEYQDERGGWCFDDEDDEEEDDWDLEDDEDALFCLDDEDDEAFDDMGPKWGPMGAGPDLRGPSDGDDWGGEDDIPF